MEQRVQLSFMGTDDDQLMLRYARGDLRAFEALYGRHKTALYRYLVTELGKLGIAYLHLVNYGNEQLVHDIRALWKQPLILNRPGRPRDQIGADVAAGLADLESYGQMVLANPDFVARLKTGAPMNAAERASFFGGTARGYTDYPMLGGAIPA